jgi:hypothetical protein
MWKHIEGKEVNAEAGRGKGGEKETNAEAE